MKSIQTKILIVVISGLLVITAVVSAIAVNMMHEIMHKDADRILNNVTLKESAYINDVLGDIQKSAEIMEHYATYEIESLSQLSDAEFLTKYLNKTKAMFLEIALNTKRVDGFFFRLNPQYTDSKTGFYNLLSDAGNVSEMELTDLSKYPENDEKNVGWYYTAVREGKPIWLDPYNYPGYDSRLISYCIPLYVDSQLLGVIGFDMDFGYLVEKINEISVYEEGYAVLLASDGKTGYNHTDIEESVHPHTKAIAPLYNGMYLELRADYQDIQKDVRPMLTKIVSAFVVVLFFSILYTIFVTRKIVRPLKQLTLAAEELSTDLSEVSLSKLAIDSKDEIGTLSNVLKDTYEKIREYTSYINALAYRDSLTGIKNSTAYTEALDLLNKEINHSNPQFAVLVADINNLKKTNDRFGHDIGNELIVHTAKILTETFKTSSVYRIGGDEFAVILKNADYMNYRYLLNNLEEACSKDFINVFENKIPVSIAYGVALFDPEIDRVYEDVFAKADHAMYLNKHESKAAAAML